MYESYRNEISCLLINKYDKATVDDIIRTIDIVSSGYDITKSEHNIIPYQYNTPFILNLYLSCKRLEGKSEQTIDNYKILLNNLFKSVGKPIAEIEANDLRIFLYTYQSNKNISNRSLDKYRSYLYCFFKWAVNEGYCQSNPMDKIAKIKYEAKQRKALTQIELEQIRDSCKTLRDKAIIELLYSTACRVSEITNIKLSDIDWDKKEIKVIGKGKKERIVFINAKAEVAIKKYLKKRNGNSEYLICGERYPYKQMTNRGIENVITEICKRCEMEWVTPHIFRHTTATMALNNGMGIESISRMLGHSSINTTMIYAETNDVKLHQEHLKTVV